MLSVPTLTYVGSAVYIVHPLIKSCYYNSYLLSDVWFAILATVWIW